jgi:predicted ATP-dependent endonuclease of OLD family
MFYLAHVEITGFWGKYRVDTQLHDDVNIIIGKNGTGKTTFMNLLQGVLAVDLRLLSAHEFEKISLKLKSGSTVKTISVRKQSSVTSPYAIVTFKVGRKSFEIPLIPRELEALRLPHRNSRIGEVYQELKSLIDKFVNIASLSVHRATFDYFEEDEYLIRRSRRESSLSPIDQRLKELVTALTQYQLSLAEKANEISAKFQKDVLTSILYDEKFDRFDLNEAMQIRLGQDTRELTNAYNELGVLDNAVKARIASHIEAVQRSLTKFRAFEEKRQLDLNDILPLPLLRRTQYIINLSLEADKQKQLVSEPIRQFTQLLIEFMRDKEISVNPSTGELIIFRDKKQ